MVLFNLNIEEVVHIHALRAVISTQRERIMMTTKELAAPPQREQPQERGKWDNVIRFRPRVSAGQPIEMR